MISIRLIIVMLVAITHVHAADQRGLNKQLYDALLHGFSLARVKELVEVRGADINGVAEHSLFRTPPLHLAVRTKTQDSSVMLYLIGRGVDVNAKDSDGLTPCHCAAEFNRVDFVKILVTNGADVNAESKNGHTPLHSACRTDALDAVEELIKYGADTQKRDNTGKTPLSFARKYGCQAVVKFLEEYESIPDVKEPDVC